MPISIPRKLGVISICVLVPALSTFLMAQHHLNVRIQPGQALELDGLLVKQATLDIGTVWSGGQYVQRDYVLENRTGHPVKIASVTSDCGCTVAKAVSGEVANGQSTKIPVVFWPPAVSDDHGGGFRRNISVVVNTFTGSESLDLSLTGFVAPDESLRVFPVNIELPDLRDAVQAPPILHLKGSITVLRNIPDKLFVSPGRHERVLVHIPPAGHIGEVTAKDVTIYLAPNAKAYGTGQWNSTITFAPDPYSDGMTIHVHGDLRQPIIASPASVILTDDLSGTEATVRITTDTGSLPVLESIQTQLPVTWEIIRQSAANSRFIDLRIRAGKVPPVDIAGTLQVHGVSQNMTGELLSIPVVILHNSIEHR